MIFSYSSNCVQFQLIQDLSIGRATPLMFFYENSPIRVEEEILFLIFPKMRGYHTLSRRVYHL